MVMEPLTGVRTPFTMAKAPLTVVMEEITVVMEPLTGVRTPLTMVKTPLTVVMEKITVVMEPLTGVRTPLTMVKTPLTVVMEEITVVMEPLTRVRTPLTMVRLQTPLVKKIFTLVKRHPVPVRMRPAAAKKRISRQTSKTRCGEDKPHLAPGRRTPNPALDTDRGNAARSPGRFRARRSRLSGTSRKSTFEDSPLAGLNAPRH